jgi:DNA-binding NarL/FixJ family response regulator
MNSPKTTKPVLHVALVESDPLRLIGLLALLESESDLELISTSLSEITISESIDVVLIGDRPGQSLFDTMSQLKRLRANLRMIVTGPSASDEIMLNAVAYGANGYVFDEAPPSEFARALRVVSQGSMWAPRRVLSMFIERAITQQRRMRFGTIDVLSDRDKEILTLLVSGLSNKEISAPLGIVARTVEAHISRMMRRLGVRNRIELSACAVGLSLITVFTGIDRNAQRRQSEVDLDSRVSR